MVRWSKVLIHHDKLKMCKPWGLAIKTWASCDPMSRVFGLDVRWCVLQAGVRELILGRVSWSVEPGNLKMGCNFFQQDPIPIFFGFIQRIFALILLKDNEQCNFWGNGHVFYPGRSKNHLPVACGPPDHLQRRLSHLKDRQESPENFHGSRCPIKTPIFWSFPELSALSPFCWSKCAKKRSVLLELAVLLEPILIQDDQPEKNGVYSNQSHGKDIWNSTVNWRSIELTVMSRSHWADFALKGVITVGWSLSCWLSLIFSNFFFSVKPKVAVGDAPGSQQQWFGPGVLLHCWGRELNDARPNNKVSTKRMRSWIFSVDLPVGLSDDPFTVTIKVSGSISVLNVWSKVTFDPMYSPYQHSKPWRRARQLHLLNPGWILSSVLSQLLNLVIKSLLYSEDVTETNLTVYNFI